MTKAIEKTLNLPSLEEALKSLHNPEDQVEKIASALQNTNHSLVTDDQSHVAVHAKEMDEIYVQAIKAHKEMLDLGFNVEAKNAGSVFEPAARFLEIAMNASKSKSDQKLRTLKLRMDREKLDHELGKDTQDGVINSISPTGFVADRNDLLKDLVGKLRDSRVPKR